MLKELLILTLATKMSETLRNVSVIVAFFRLHKSNPNITMGDMDAEQIRLMDGMADILERVPLSQGGSRECFKAALLHLAEQL